jgi:hypothetical protein
MALQVLAARQAGGGSLPPRRSCSGRRAYSGWKLASRSSSTLRCTSASM